MESIFIYILLWKLLSILKDLKKILTIHCFDGSSILQLLNSTFGSRCSRNRQSSPHWYPAKSQFLSCVIWFWDGFKPLSCGLGLESVLSTAWRRNPSDSTPRSQRCPSWTSWRIGRTQGTCSANKSVNIQQCCSNKVRWCCWNVSSNKWKKVLVWNTPLLG